MKTLVVHDREEITSEIMQLINDADVVVDAIDVAEDYHSARQALSTTIYDLLVIDLTIPLNKNSGEASYAPVEQLLNELFTMDTLNVPGDIIGITREVETLQLINSSLGPHLMVAIHEDIDGKWKKYLVDKILYAQRASLTRSVSINRHYLYDVLIVTAMDVEMEPFRDYFEMLPLKHFDGASEFLFCDAAGQTRKGVAYAIGRSGQPSAASLSQALITFFRPRLALMSGYCGGVEGKVNLGDVIFFDAAYAWDYGKWIEEGDPPLAVFLSRPNPISIVDEPLDRMAREYARADLHRRPDFLREVSQKSLGKLQSLDLYIGPVASGSAVVTNRAIVDQIRGLSDNIWAVDMECYGFYHASRHTRVIKPNFICVKSVSDFCDGEKGNDLHDACSFISASLLIDLLTSRWEF